MEGYSYEQTMIPVRARQRILVADLGYACKEGNIRVRKRQTHKMGIGKIVYGGFVSLLALIVSLGSSGSVFLASAFEPDVVEGHIVNVVAKIEMPFQEEEEEEQIVLNEILPNPEGSDSQDGLAGEWVELYNNGSSTVDVAGWYIKDFAGNTKIISLTNTHTGETLIGANGSGFEWLVVFMNTSVLNNTGGDTVSLYDSADILVDSHAYGSFPNDSDGDSKNSPGGDNDTPTGSESGVQEGKSIARIPDGTGEWIDPIPTPGGPNRVEPFDFLQQDSGQAPQGEEPVVASEESEVVPVVLGGGGAVGSIAGPDEETPGETPVETPADLSVDEAETPTETPVEIPVEAPAEAEQPVVTEPAENPEDIEADPPPATTSPDVGGGGETPATVEEAV